MNDINVGQVEELLAPAVEALGCIWWGCVLRKQAHLLRIYIDKADGVSVDDCAAVSHQVSGVLTVDNLLSDYTLEVSSPGLDRPLFVLSQYKAYIGQELKLRLRLPLKGQRNFQGVLSDVSENTFTLKCDASLVQFKFEDVERANIVPDFTKLG